MFEVDDSHALILGVILSDELFAFEQYEVPTNYRRFEWVADKRKLDELRNGTVLVRLTAPYSGYCYLEGEFELSTTPLALSPVLAKR